MNDLLMTPGPVSVPQAVLDALARPVLHHRTPEFETILARVLDRLSTVFGTRQRAFILAATGSGAMESALVNTLSADDKVIAICAGKFGERWAEMAERFGCRVHRLAVPWGEDLDPQVVARALRETPETRA